MKAITFAQFGGPEVLRLADVPEPQASSGNIRIRVRAAGVNPIDSKIRRGFMERVFPTPLPSIPGIDVAGIVDQVGPDVSGVTIGDEVLGWADTGSYAQYTLSQKFVRKPNAMTWSAAAALPVASEAAQRVLDLLRVTAGEAVVVHGAAGAVGSIAVQLAVARGATVIGTASATNQDYVRSLGATPVTYGDGLVERIRLVAPGGVNAAFDVAGHDALEASIELTGGTERVITIADMNAQKYGVRFAAGTAADRSTTTLAELVKSHTAGALQIAIAQVFPLSEAEEAQRISEAGHVQGKLVLLVE